MARKTAISHPQINDLVGILGELPGGRWPFVVRVAMVFVAAFRRGGDCPRCHGKGHRLCHSSTMPPLTAGGQSPRPAPAPPPAGASPPPGRALVFHGAPTCRSTGPRRARAGETRVAFPGPAQWGDSTPRFHGRGHRPCHSGTLASGPAGGPKPPASARPAPGGRFSPAGPGAGLCCAGGTGLAWGVPRGRGKRGSRFLVPPGRAIPFPGSARLFRPPLRADRFFSSLPVVSRRQGFRAHTLQKVGLTVLKEHAFTRACRNAHAAGNFK